MKLGQAETSRNIFPPYYVEFAGPATKGCCRKDGPFESIEQATLYAIQKGGIKKAPLDGWFQVKDSRGELVLIT